MCLRFVFLLTTRLAAWLWLSRRKETWKRMAAGGVTANGRQGSCAARCAGSGRVLAAGLRGIARRGAGGRGWRPGLRGVPGAGWRREG
ncbi:MAG TPA: hypothetical protein VMV92_23695 [Streptosporangiaceae bacterium]|nr:hypothetical protein [Streptosporangiaceae bacterium]